jgi:hypothetical protein
VGVFVSTSKLAGWAEVKKPLVKQLLAQWRAGGHVLHRPGRHAGREVDTWSPARRAPLPPAGTPSETDQDRMWRAMKMMKTFTVQDLALHAAVPGAEIPVGTARAYLLHLQRAGYVAAQRSAMNAPAAYRFLKSTGPKAPRVLKLPAVWDPNLQKIAWIQPAEEVAGA